MDGFSLSSWSWIARLCCVLSDFLSPNTWFPKLFGEGSQKRIFQHSPTCVLLDFVFNRTWKIGVAVDSVTLESVAAVVSDQPTLGLPNLLDRVLGWFVHLLELHYVEEWFGRVFSFFLIPFFFFIETPQCQTGISKTKFEVRFWHIVKSIPGFPISTPLPSVLRVPNSNFSSSPTQSYPERLG